MRAGECPVCHGLGWFWIIPPWIAVRSDGGFKMYMKQQCPNCKGDGWFVINRDVTE